MFIRRNDFLKTDMFNAITCVGILFRNVQSDRLLRTGMDTGKVAIDKIFVVYGSFSKKFIFHYNTSTFTISPVAIEKSMIKAI